MTIGKKEQLYIVLLVAALIYAVYAYGWQPLSEKHVANLAQISTLSEQLEQARRNAKKLPEILEQSQKVNRQFEETKKILVEKIEIEGLYKIFDPLFDQAGINKNEVEGITRVGEQPGDFYIESRWNISVKVPFEKLALLLLEFDRFERLLDVTSLPLTIVGTTKGGEPIVQIALPVSTYTIKDEEKTVKK